MALFTSALVRSNRTCIRPVVERRDWSPEKMSSRIMIAVKQHNQFQSSFTDPVAGLCVDRFGIDRHGKDSWGFSINRSSLQTGTFEALKEALIDINLEFREEILTALDTYEIATKWIMRKFGYIPPLLQRGECPMKIYPFDIARRAVSCLFVEGFFMQRINKGLPFGKSVIYPTGAQPLLFSRKGNIYINRRKVSKKHGSLELGLLHVLLNKSSDLNHWFDLSGAAELCPRFYPKVLPDRPRRWF